VSPRTGAFASQSPSNNESTSVFLTPKKPPSFNRDLSVSFISSREMLSYEGRPPISSAWNTLYLRISGLTFGSFNLSFNANNLTAQ
jgi:hypothetical protein